MLLPYYTISKRNGFSGGGETKYLPFGIISKTGYPNVAVEGVREYRFNPYRDIAAGGTSFGFRGKNYWISDKGLLGKIIKNICK